MPAKDPTGGGSKLTSDEIRGYAAAAGFTGTTLDNMVGIAFAESGGNPSSHNSTPPDDSYGLWQINMIGSLGPARRKQFGISNNEQLYNPATNAKAAYVVFKSQGLNAWTTYKNGAYLKYTDGKGGTGGQEAPAEDNSLGGISAAINSVGKNIFNGLANSVGIGLAIALLLAGVAILITQNRTAKNLATKTIGKVVP